MINYQNISRAIIFAALLMLINRQSASALLLGNIIGCNSFGCRLSALENDVVLLKQQVARLSDPNMNPRPNSMNQGFGLNTNQGGFGQGGQGSSGAGGNINQGGFGQGGQGSSGAGGGGGRGSNSPQDSSNQVRYALDYPTNQQTLQRLSNTPYQNSFNNQQLFRA